MKRYTTEQSAPQSSTAKDDRQYRVSAVYDTETCNVGSGADTRAFPILFIWNELQRTVEEYVPERDDDVRMHRYAPELLHEVERLIERGEREGFIPIVAAYNLMFDLMPIMHNLNESYELEVIAQNTSTVYVLDLKCEGRTMLRFWDTWHLELNGLSAMGEICGFEKATGDWDYSLIRTPETPLTAQEMHYAKRDVQVIPAYLRFVIESNSFINPSDLGFKVITKTSLVRQMAKHEIGSLKRKGAKKHVMRDFQSMCQESLPPDYRSYATRKACFRGGLTFTAANFAMMPVNDVYSLDVTSMHHAFMVRDVPERMNALPAFTLELMLEHVANRTRAEVLKSYERPFECAFHACVEFFDLRLRDGFEWHGIAICPQAKFAKSEGMGGYDESLQTIAAYTGIKQNGYRDAAVGAVFAFGKLMAADRCRVWVSEIEFWNMCQVYEFSSFRAIAGEGTCAFAKAPNYVTLQSQLLFKRKTETKNLVREYIEGIPFAGHIGDSIPISIAKSCRSGSCRKSFLEGFYNSTVKGNFNSIYGTQAQDLYRPEYVFNDNGDFLIDNDTIANEDNFEDKQPKVPKVNYPLGLRIVGGSRQHLVIAMQLLMERFGNQIVITGGDTDSLKISVCPGITADILIEALEPLHAAVRESIRKCTDRTMEQFPDVASRLEHVGEFEVENSVPYQCHMESWNKARISFDGKRAHLTCAGLSRPANVYNAEDAFTDMIGEIGFEEAATQMLGFNSIWSAELSNSLEHYRPSASDRFKRYVTDYLGHGCIVDTYQSIALYPANRTLGDTSALGNLRSCQYLGDYVDSRSKLIYLEDGKVRIRFLE